LLIRTYRESDIGDIAELEKKAFEVGPYSKYTLRRLFRVKSSFNLVAEIDGKIAGYVIALPLDRNSADIESIAVDPDYQGKGIGGTLISRIEEEMKIRGHRLSVLEVRDRNYESIEFYRRHGYSEIEHIPLYYREEFRGSRGAYRMIKKL
jgi:ribosomal-protein-alanine N-acetyltransferase